MQQMFLGLQSATGGFSGVTSNLAVHWDFGDTNCWSGGTAITDLTGNGNGGTLKGGSFGGTSTNGFSAQTANGGSIRFSTDEDDDPRISRDGTDFFDSITDDDFTLEFWIRPYWNASVSGGSTNTPNFHIFTNYPSADQNLRLVLREDGGNLRLRAPFHGAWEYITTGNAFNISTNSFASNWSHLVITRGDTSASTYKTYLNNSLVNTRTESGDYGQATSASNRAIGHQSTTSTTETNRYYGDFAVYRFYNGKALTSTEVATNYNVSASRFGL